MAFCFVKNQTFASTAHMHIQTHGHMGISFFFLSEQVCEYISTTFNNVSGIRMQLNIFMKLNHLSAVWYLKPF